MRKLLRRADYETRLLHKTAEIPKRLENKANVNAVSGPFKGWIEEPCLNVNEGMSGLFSSATPLNDVDIACRRAAEATNSSDEMERYRWVARPCGGIRTG